MSSATTSLFASVAIAAVGATGFAYTLSHPGVLASAVTKLMGEKTWRLPVDRQKPVAIQEKLQRNDAGTAVLPAGDYGHFQADAEINGRAVRVMVDTGASLVALTYEDAESVGIFVRPSDFTHIAQTANGTARVAPVTIPRITIGDVSVRNVPAVVSERGKSERTLLGMSFLGKLSRVEMRDGTLVLQE